MSGKAIGVAFEEFVKTGTEVGKEIGDQSKRIISKKYGEDLVRTITGEQAP